jgi:hypothetical protein
VESFSGVGRLEAWTWVYDGPHAVLQLHDADGDGSGDFALTNRYLYGNAVDMILGDEQLPESRYR